MSNYDDSDPELAVPIQHALLPAPQSSHDGATVPRYKDGALGPALHRTIITHYPLPYSYYSSGSIITSAFSPLFSSSFT